MPPEMSNKEAIQMMQRCINEIEHLRTHLSSQAPKAEAYDLINKIVGFVPGGS